jgi:predicted glycoside hydrolase/deacetylase ChbG (UPF0249 family)
MSSAVRRLIVNADDFGRSATINDGIAHGHDHGIVTSASLMVRWPAARAAAAYARTRPSLSVGLHFDLCEWSYEGGGWRPVYEVVHTGEGAAIETELERQLDMFEELVGHPPTHLDSHQHVHREEPVRSAILAAAERLGVAVRELAGGVGYLGDFYGQDGMARRYHAGISREHLIGLVRSLPAGTTELGCHPAMACERESSYASERPMELAVLCDPLVAAVLREEGIELTPFTRMPIGEVRE